MTRNRQVILAVLAVVVLIVVLVLLPFGKGNATTGVEPCVPQDAYSETINHPAVTHNETVVVTPEVPAVPAVPEIWAVWAPNDTKGPQDYTPVWPSDERGTWEVLKDSIPPGHDRFPDGVYQTNDNGNSNYFYKQTGKDAVPAIPAVTEVVVVTDVAAYTEVINHPAVVCDTPTPTPTVTPETPTETPTVPTETPTVTPNPEPETPVSSPPKPPKDVQVIECVDGVFVTTVNGEVISESGSCVEREENETPVTFTETGL